MHLAIAEEQGVPRTKVDGTIQNDMLKEFIAQKECISPHEPSMRLVVDMIKCCAKHAPRWHPISISDYPFRTAGSTAVAELVFTLADRVRHVVQSAFKRPAHPHLLGRRGQGNEAVFDEVRGIRDGGGFGSIIGRNSFQRPKQDALAFLGTVMDIFAGKQK